MTLLPIIRLPSIPVVCTGLHLPDLELRVRETVHASGPAVPFCITRGQPVDLASLFVFFILRRHSCSLSIPLTWISPTDP